MTSIKKTSPLWFTVVAAVCLFPALLSAHLKLMRTAPAADATLESPPAQLQLWFSEEPLLPLSGITLTGPKGVVKLDALKAGPERSLVVAIGTAGAPLEPGAYRIGWKAAGDDGHVAQGSVNFTVKARTQPPK